VDEENKTLNREGREDRKAILPSPGGHGTLRGFDFRR
jgi:hypothetical protein